MREASNAVVHFYRAAVMHADVWRRRLDATTNWAVVSVAGIVTFTLSSDQNPHFALLLGVLFGSFFLIMEARRYQTFDMWHRRVHMLNRWVVAPALSPATAPSDEEIEEGLSKLARELGTSVPPMAFIDALGYRIRRNYAFLLASVVGAWFLKVWYHPAPAATWAEFMDHAAVGPLRGTVVLALCLLLVVMTAFVALRARTERMEEWAELPSPLQQALGHPRPWDSEDESE